MARPSRKGMADPARLAQTANPAYDLLLENDVPPDVAQEFAGKTVSVNYHPGSLCCLPDGYRFRDGHGGRWPVRAVDCVMLGYGDRDERLA
ncbi:MAG: hypothetical protein ABSA41_06370 [Terriglobia bacterium]